MMESLEKVFWLNFTIARGVTDALQKQALLLHLAGLEVQDIYDHTLPQAEGANVYDKTVNAGFRLFSAAHM